MQAIVRICQPEKKGFLSTRALY